MNDPNDIRDVIARSNFAVPHVVHPLAMSGAEIAAAQHEHPDKIRELAIPEDSKRRAEQLERAFGGVGVDFNPDRVPIRVYRAPPGPPSKVPGESKLARRMRRRNLRLHLR